MRHKNAAREARATTGQRFIPISSVSAAVLFALYGVPNPVTAQQADTSDTLREITVTATRREVALEAVPYRISRDSACSISARD
jgi:outer membrane receptor protein involved in Fe transport